MNERYFTIGLVFLCAFLLLKYWKWRSLSEQKDGAILRLENVCKQYEEIYENFIHTRDTAGSGDSVPPRRVSSPSVLGRREN